MPDLNQYDFATERERDEAHRQSANVDAWAEMFSAAGFCAADYGYDGYPCDDNDGDACRYCWLTALREFAPDESAGSPRFPAARESASGASPTEEE